MVDTLGTLAADLARATTLILPVAEAVVQASADAVQARWRATYPWNSTRHLKHLGRSITVESSGTAVSRVAEIGPLSGQGPGGKHQGSLGHIIEFGSIKSHAHPGGGPAAMVQAPVFAASLMIAAEALLAGSGGVKASMATSTPSRYNAPVAPPRSGAST